MESNVTRELLAACKLVGKSSGLDASIITRWSEAGGHTLELNAKVKGIGGETVESTARFSVDGHIERYDAPDRFDHLFAYPMNVRPAISLANVAKVGDAVRLYWLLGNGSDRSKAAGVTLDRCTIEVWRKCKAGRWNLAAELVHDERMVERTASYGMVNR